MPLSTINNGDSGSTARAAINAVIAEVNLLGSAAYQNTTAFDAAGDAAAAMNALLSGNNSWGDLQTFARISFAGNISAGAWLTGGLRTVGVAGTLTDTTSSGTVSSACTHKIAGDTIAASNATTFTNYFSTYVTAPVAGTNVTLTNAWALGADSLCVGTITPFKVTSAGAATVQNLMTYAGGTNSVTPTILARFSNTTAAISGTQSASTGIEFVGQGFKTGTGSQETKWRIYNLPVQGATLDTGLMFGYSVNGGAYTDQMRLTGTDGVHFKGLAFNGDISLLPSLSLTSTKLTLTTTTLVLDFSSASKHSWSSTAYTLAEGVNIVAGTSTGTKIGSATTQKFAFWNATPVVQPAHIADPSGGAIQDAEARAAIVSILAWQATLGLTAAS